MTELAITFDYRCPFARNAAEHLLAALDGGAPWDVHYVPFSLGQAHVEEGGTDVWDRPETDSGLLALQVGVAVRDAVEPATFRAVHRDLFALRHDHGGNLKDRAALAEVLERHGVDTGPVFEAVDDGRALKVVRHEHEAAVRDHAVWGVPTFIVGDQAAFVRLMDRPDGDAARGRQSIERIIDLLTDAPTLNEFKHTSIPR
jgi:predicted DsbA family dithiol-disulfide isomerase